MIKWKTAPETHSIKNYFTEEEDTQVCREHQWDEVKCAYHYNGTRVIPNTSCTALLVTVYIRKTEE